GGKDRGGDRLGRFMLGVVVHEDASACSPKAARDRRTDPARGASDERELAAERAHTALANRRPMPPRGNRRSRGRKAGRTTASRVAERLEALGLLHVQHLAPA